MYYPSTVIITTIGCLCIINIACSMLNSDGRSHKLFEREIGSFGQCNAKSCIWSGCTNSQWSTRAHGCPGGQYLCGNERACTGGWQYRCCDVEADFSIHVRETDKLKGRWWWRPKGLFSFRRNKDGKFMEELLEWRLMKKQERLRQKYPNPNSL